MLAVCVCVCVCVCVSYFVFYIHDTTTAAGLVLCRKDHRALTNRLNRSSRNAQLCDAHSRSSHHDVALIGWHYLSNATCLMRPRLFLCVVYSVKEHHQTNVLHVSPHLKNICVRQVVLDEWFPLIQAVASWERDLK